MRTAISAQIRPPHSERIKTQIAGSRKASEKLDSSVLVNATPRNLGEHPTSPRCAPGVPPVPHAQALERPRKARVSPRCRTTKLGRVPEVNENCNLHSDKRSQLWAKKTSDYRQPELLKKVDSSAVFIYIKRTCCSSRRSMSTAISTQMRHPHSERNKFR